MNHKQCLQLNRRAATVVEMAFVLPVIFLFFTAMIEISRLLMLQHSVDTAAYEGARNAMVPGATAQDAIDSAQKLLTAARLKSATVTIDPPIITEQTAVVTVTVQLPVDKNSWISPFFFKGAVTSEVSLFCERPPMIQLTGIPQMKIKAGAGGKPNSSL